MIRFRSSGVECLVTDDFEVVCDDVSVSSLVKAALSFEVGPSEGFFWQVMAFRRIPEMLGVDAIEVLEITSIEEQFTSDVLY